MASSTQTVVEEDSVEELPSSVNSPVTGEERAGLLERGRQASLWPDTFNKATEISLNIGGLPANFRIGAIILLVLVLCIMFIARWPTSCSPTGSQPSGALTLDLSDILPVNVSTAEDTKNPHTTVSLGNKNSIETDSSKTPSAQALSTFSPAITGLSDGEISQVLEKAIQGLRYPTDQNETIEELQALNRELILKAHQQAVEETVQTLKKKVIRLIAWVSVAVAITDPVLVVFFISIRVMLRLYWCRRRNNTAAEVDDRADIGSLCSPSPEPRHVVNPWQRYTVRSAFPWPFVVRILSQSIYLGSAVYFLCKEQRTAGDVTIIAGCGLSLLLSALSHTSAASTFWHNLARIIGRSYNGLHKFCLRGVSRLPGRGELNFDTGSYGWVDVSCEHQRFTPAEPRTVEINDLRCCLRG